MSPTDERRCPGCAPGIGEGKECRHHQIAHRPDVQFALAVDVRVRRAERSMARRIEEALFG